MTSVQLNIINMTIRNLLEEIDRLKAGRVKREDVLKTIDELEDQIDDMLTRLAQRGSRMRGLVPL